MLILYNAYTCLSSSMFISQYKSIACFGQVHNNNKKDKVVSEIDEVFVVYTIS